MNDRLVTPENLDAMEKNNPIINQTANIPVDDCWNSHIFIKIALTICFILFIIFITNISNISLVK